MSATLHAEIVDPRYVTAEEDSPAYRVDFWSTADSGRPADGTGVFTEEWRITGAGSVQDVISWAEANGNGREYVLGVEFRDGAQVALVRLAGRMPS